MKKKNFLLERDVVFYSNPCLETPRKVANTQGDHYEIHG